jgi:autotransporter-associated beta strand protein
LRGSQNSGSAATTYTIGGRNSDSAFAGAIKTGAGGTGAKVNLVKVGTGALTLSGANTYNGTTVINGGTLALSGAGSISSTPTISVFTNTVLDVSARTDGTITLSSGQTLQGSGTVRGSLTAQSGSIINVGDDLGLPEPMSVTNVLTLQSGSTLNMDVDHYQYAGGATNDTIQGLAQINYGGNLNLNVISVETNSVFKLFSATNYSGAFDSITPATPASLSGGPWAWDTSKLTVDGTLRVAMAKLVISSFVTSGSDIILNATGGTPFGTVNVLSTTNLTQPILQWTTVTSGSFDGSGNFNYTISGALNSGLPQDFFILQTQ